MKNEFHQKKVGEHAINTAPSREQDHYGVGLDNSTLYTLQYIVGAPPERMYNFIVNEEVLGKLRKIVTRYMEHYVGREFKSLEILKQITSCS